jgi:hypothetical protein
MCKSDGSSSYGFKYGHVGETVTAPIWSPSKMCGKGLHGLRNGNGEWSLLDGDDWLVIEALEEDVVDIDEDKCKFRTGKIIFRGDKSGLHKFAPLLANTSKSAYRWATTIGDHHIIKNRIIEPEWAYRYALFVMNNSTLPLGEKTWFKKFFFFSLPKNKALEKMKKMIIDSEWAYQWAKVIGDREIMRDRVTNSEWAYYWARDIGDHEIMRERITESQWAYIWARKIGDREIMIDRVTESQWAYCWAIQIGDKEIMRERITESKWAYEWAKIFGDRDVMRERITESEWAYIWARYFGDKVTIFNDS